MVVVERREVVVVSRWRVFFVFVSTVVVVSVGYVRRVIMIMTIIPLHFF